MFLNDQETATDLLYYEAIAKTVVTLIRKTPDAPVTIGVHGDWGAGKSSVLKMLEGAFKDDDRVLCLWFNGWTFEGFEDAKTVVIETIVDELRRARPMSKKVADAAKKVLKRVDWLKLARKAGGFAFTAATGIPTFDQVKGLYDVATSFLAKPQDHVSIEDLKSVAEKAGEFIKEAPEESDNLPEHIHAFRKEFKELLDAADIDQLVVIVDDLDRCLPKTAIATLEAIHLFLFVERTAFVIGADELMIEYAVREHFPDLPPSSGPVSYARNYLEKLIQVPFRIPALGVAETRVYVTLLLHAIRNYAHRPLPHCRKTRPHAHQPTCRVTHSKFKRAAFLHVIHSLPFLDVVLPHLREQAPVMLKESRAGPRIPFRLPRTWRRRPIWLGAYVLPAGHVQPCARRSCRMDDRSRSRRR